MIVVRDAVDSDASAIRDIFLATYGEDYAYPDFYDLETLRKMIYGGDTVLLVAEDSDSQQVLGTGSVVLQIGAFADLVGEFGRLAVHPAARGKGCGHRIMDARIERVQDQLHLGLVENRAVHAFSQKISRSHGFVPLGFLPHKLCLASREHIALYGRYFCDALSLRRNHPHVIPEAAILADMALTNCRLPPDAIVDDHSAALPHDDDYSLESLTTAGYSTLLRFERGRVRNREVFGPMRLHYGLFQLKASHSNYLIARRDGQIVGGVGYLFDEVERNIRLLEIVSIDDAPVRFLLKELLRISRETLHAEYVEVDVSAYAPRMQRTLLELGFLPAAYIPALVFHQVERLDAVRMIRLLVPFDAAGLVLHESCQAVADLVIPAFEAREIQPQIATAAPGTMLFRDLNDEQAHQVAVICRARRFAPGETILRRQESDGMTYVVLSGEVRVTAGNAASNDEPAVGSVGSGECLGELSLIDAAPHSATAVAATSVETAAINHEDFAKLVRQRPDIAAIVFRNLAAGLGAKLLRTDRMVANPESHD